MAQVPHDVRDERLLRRSGGRLAVRMGAGLVIGAAAILLAAATWNLRLQRAHLTRLVSAAAERIAETIRRSTHDDMLRNDRDALRRMVATVGAQPGLVRIRIFNKEGRIRSSTRPEEVGRLVDKHAEECDACHQTDRPLTRLPGHDRVRLFRDAEGQRVLGVVAPIHNEPGCVGCHDPAQTVLGVLDVQLSMTSVDQSVRASERQLLFTLALTVASMASLAGLLIWRLVLAPVGRLEQAMSCMAAGQSGLPVAVTSNDEMGRLGRAWNALVAELERARVEIDGWRHTLERRVQEKTAELERTHERMLAVEKLASLGKLSAVVAHEINNPLAGIRTFARLLQRRLPAAVPEHPDAPASANQHMLEMIASESARCGDIVRNLLTFARAAPANFALETLPPLLERCVLLLRHQAELLGVELVLEPLSELPAIECDAHQIQQLLMALTMNGLEATPSGGRVLLSAVALDDSVRLIVSDTGTGIRPEDREHIFEPFFTTKKEGKGVGLGLAVAYGIVSRHHGHIEVRPQAGTGSVFAITLPRRQPREQDSEGAP
jgi:two-component system NtrC family sensor kinase